VFYLNQFLHNFSKLILILYIKVTCRAVWPAVCPPCFRALPEPFFFFFFVFFFFFGFCFLCQLNCPDFFFFFCSTGALCTGFTLVRFKGIEQNDLYVYQTNFTLKNSHMNCFFTFCNDMKPHDTKRQITTQN
jgi:hypothetical protein